MAFANVGHKVSVNYHAIVAHDCDHGLATLAGASG